MSCYTPLKNALNGGYYGTRGVMMRIARADEVEFRNDISEVYQACYFYELEWKFLVARYVLSVLQCLVSHELHFAETGRKQEILSADFIDKVKENACLSVAFICFSWPRS